MMRPDGMSRLRFGWIVSYCVAAGCAKAAWVILRDFRFLATLLVSLPCLLAIVVLLCFDKKTAKRFSVWITEWLQHELQRFRAAHPEVLPWSTAR